MDEIIVPLLLVVVFICALLIGTGSAVHKVSAQNVATAITTCDQNGGLRYIRTFSDTISARCNNGVTFEVGGR